MPNIPIERQSPGASAGTPARLAEDPAQAKAKAAEERKKVAMTTIGLTACTPTAIAAFFPPAVRSFVSATAMSVSIPATSAGVTVKHDDTPDSLFHQGVGNFLQAAPITPVLVLQQALTHPDTVTGKGLASAQNAFAKSWESLCTKNPLLPKALGRAPVIGTATRIYAQLYSTKLGADLKSSYYKALDTPVKIYDEGETEAGVSMGPVVKSLLSDRDFHAVGLLPLLVYSPQGRAAILKALLKHTPQQSNLAIALKTEVAGGVLFSGMQFGMAQHAAIVNSRKKAQPDGATPSDSA